MPLPILLDWVYATYVEGLDEKGRKEFDWQLEQLRDGGEAQREEAKRQRRELARLNAGRKQG